MGIVYRAEQQNPQRSVALKVIRLGIATPEDLRRFEQETKLVGRLQHPGIAQIYEAGTANSGVRWRLSAGLS
jgi:eukaryotic-like serine/threonine-protein kinase